MSVLWTRDQAVAATHGRSDRNWQATGVSIDTRSLQPGDLFVALKDVRDGHDFVAAALQAGAAAALVSRRPEDVPADAPLLLVDDVLDALRGLAKAARARSRAKVIAVTGSAGKTSTKDMLRQVLAGQGVTHAAHLSFNNHWGVPLTLARLPVEAEFAIVEIGMNHSGEISPLSQLARPDAAIITTVAEAHMAAFRSIEDIARAKAEIFDGLEPGSVAIVNRDIATYPILEAAAAARQVTLVGFGSDPAADWRISEIALTGDVTTVQAVYRREKRIFKVGAAGRHHAMNGLAVLAAADILGADPAIAAADLGRWHPPAGRGARHRITLDRSDETLSVELIDDAYNANPASMAAAFEVLAASTPQNGLGRVGPGRRIAFLSDMLELGDAAPARHAEIAELAALDAVDRVHLAGPLMAHLHRALPADKQGEWFDTAEALAQRAARLIDAGDVVMVKGSKGSKASLVVDAIKKLGQAVPEQD